MRAATGTILVSMSGAKRLSIFHLLHQVGFSRSIYSVLPDPEALGAPSLSLSPPAKRKSGIHPELIILEQIYQKSAWLIDNELEPEIGQPNCPSLAEKYGILGTSCYTAFVRDEGDGGYGCRYARCHAFLTSSLDDAVRHQRCHHFEHAPFVCVPPSGQSW